MTTNLTDANRPLRALDKVIQGGLGKGNIGVLASRHGTGKLAVLTSIAIDHAMDGRNVLHVALNESVQDIRAYDDEVFSEIAASLGIEDRADVLANVERHKQIYTYRTGGFSVDRLGETLAFLRDRAEFQPEMVELQGWPDFRSLAPSDFGDLKKLALEHECEIWCNAHTTRDDAVDDRGVPEFIARFVDDIEVLVALEPEGRHVNLKFIKTHDQEPPEGINLEFHPRSMLIRWR